MVGLGCFCYLCPGETGALISYVDVIFLVYHTKNNKHLYHWRSLTVPSLGDKLAYDHSCI